MVVCLIWLSAFFPLVLLVVFLFRLSSPSPWVCVLVGVCFVLLLVVFLLPLSLFRRGSCGVSCLVCVFCFSVLLARGFPFGLCCF